MPQVFHPSANTLLRLTLFGMAVGPLGLLVVTYLLIRSPYQTGVRVIREQPVPFSHEHHVRGLGIDCRYCHTSVETSAFAGIPPTYTCMSCHSQIWSSLRRAEREDPAFPTLSTWPLPHPTDWLQHVNQPQTEAEVAAMRCCVNRGRPFGDPHWVTDTAE